MGQREIDSHNEGTETQSLMFPSLLKGTLNIAKRPFVDFYEIGERYPCAAAIIILGAYQLVNSDSIKALEIANKAENPAEAAVVLLGGIMLTFFITGIAFATGAGAVNGLSSDREE